MNPCQNCGKINSAETNFCRFCGTRFVYRQSAMQDPVGYSAPRPYSWKTDEFDSRNTSPAVSTPLNDFGAAALAGSYARPVGLNVNQSLDGSYRCPRCGSSHFPMMERRISTAGWIVFSVLLVTTIIFFWIGLLMKEDAAICPACRAKVN